jgi:hypothetical protein
MDTLRELLIKSSQTRQRSGATKNKVDVLIRKDEILAELRKGWSRRAIWNVLKDAGELTCCYSAFAAQLARILKGEVEERNE